MATQDHKKIVDEFFSLIMEGKPKDGLHFFAPDCKQHNPYVIGGMEALLDSMASVQQEESPKYPDPDFSIKNIIADMDTVVVHTNLLTSNSRPGEGGLRQAHIFRFGEDNKIVEYWDITQQIESNMPNAEGAF